MNGPQDLGGRMGFGPVAPEIDEPIFHAEWEKRALAVTLACGALGHWTLDESRHARESLPPADYYAFSYYQIWIQALETLLMRHGELTPQELAQGRALQPGRRPERRLEAGAVPEVLSRGGPSERSAKSPARFKPGDRVRTRALSSPSHTRLPDFARDKVGVIEAINGVHVFPDANAHGRGEQPGWLYSVRFDAQTLWGAGAEAGTSVFIDAWEAYLDPA